LRSENFSQTLVVSEGIMDSRKDSNSTGSIKTTQIHLMTPRKNISQYTMAGIYPTLRMLVFHGAGIEDMK